MPNGLQASAASASLVLLAWQAATDNVGVTGYRVFRDGVQIATPATNTHSDATVAASSNYSYTVAAVDAAGNASPPSSAAPATTPAPAGNVITATPTNYRTLLAGLKPGDTLLLAPGNYGTDANGNDTADPPGLPIFNMHGTAAQPITIKGPDGGPKPLLIGRSTHNTIRFSNASYIVIKGIEVDGRDLGGSGVSASGAVHHVTLEDLTIRGVGGDQSNVGISSTGAYAWNWTIRRNLIDGAGTGMYLGNSDGTSPFVAGLIEGNVVKNTIGYNVQVKHQVVWNSPPADMPTGATTTIIRNNVFSKLSSFVSAAGARPNLLVGDQPPSGPGASNGFEIYGNFFWQNPTEALFQGEGNIALYNNLMVNESGSAVNVQRHNGAVRTVRIFSNTIVAAGGGISVSGGQTGSTQRVSGNAVFAAAPISISGADATEADNVTATVANASTYLVNPAGALGALDLFPKTGQLVRPTLSTAGLSGYTAYDRDFNGRARTWTVRGAYTEEGTNPGWRPALDFKP